MAPRVVALFGAAECGEYKRPYLLQSLEQMVSVIGHPPPESQGVVYAVQTLLFGHPVLYFRVREEGFAAGDYLAGLRLLSEEEKVAAICMPGVGDAEIIEATTPICEQRSALLILTEADLFDYLTS